MKVYDKRRNKKHVCQLCFKHGETEIHHIYEGAYRRRSDRNDFVIELCHKCHMEIHQDSSKGLALKRKTEEEFEQQYSHDEFVRRMGRSWL